MTFDHTTHWYRKLIDAKTFDPALNPFGIVSSTTTGSGVPGREPTGVLSIGDATGNANDPGPRCDVAPLGNGGLPELELLLLELDPELFELDFLICMALLDVWTCSGVGDET
jgi:hypothetical protein